MLRSVSYALRLWAPLFGLVLSVSIAQAEISPPEVPMDEWDVPPVYSGEDEELDYNAPAVEQSFGEEYGCAGDWESCESDCCCWSPCLTIRAEAIIWDRVDGSNVPFVNSPVTFGSQDFDFPWRAGPRFTIIGHNIFHSCWDAEAIYFGIDGWQADAALADIDNFLTQPTINIFGNVPGTFTYRSTLDDFEFILRRPFTDCLTWLAGFRMIQVSETQQLDIGGIAGHQVDVMNQLYGAQMGLDGLLYDRGGPFYANMITKAGIYGNNADTQTLTTGIGGALPLILAEGSSTSFVGEISLLTGYRLTDRLHAIGGYNLLWITDLALAPDQLAAVDIATGQASVDASRGVFYHGANVGLQYSW